MNTGSKESPNATTAGGVPRDERGTGPAAGHGGNTGANASPTYFRVQQRGTEIETSGQATAEFGLRLPSSGHSGNDGVFARWHWDGRRLVVQNDRYGIYPLFWFRLPSGGVCISPSLIALVELGAPTRLDAEALAVFFRLGTFLGEDTPFAAIKVIPPDTVFEWQDGKLACRGRYPPTPAASTLSRDEAIDCYIDTFAKAMARREPGSGNFAVPVSGGRDSRHILLELHRTGRQPEVCVSALDNPPDPNRDPEIGKMLCDALHFRHVTVDQRLSLLQAEERKNRETHFCAGSHGWYLALADFLDGRYEAVYDGIAGDVLSQSSFLDPALDGLFRSRDADAIAAGLLGRPLQPRLARLLKGELKPSALEDVAMHRLRKEVEKHLDNPNPIASFFFWNRTRRMTALAPFGLLKGIPRVHSPFLDHEVFDFMTTLPSSMLLDRTFHDDAIARAYPAFAHIPYADNKHDPRTDDTGVRLRFLSEAARRFVFRKPWAAMRNTRPRMRILAGVLSRGRIRTWQLPLIVYLDQIESLANTRDRR